MRKLIVANWKMNPATESAAEKLAKASDDKNVVVCPPFVYLEEVKEELKRAKLGAQDVFWSNPPQGGAFTGEVSARILKNAGAEYVIIGHSERRKWQKETDEVVNKKLKAVIAAGLTPILCVGEPKRATRDRRQGLKAAKNFIKLQLAKDLKGIPVSHVASPMSLIIAYEPIWAIGTGKPDKPAEAAAMINNIKLILDSRFKIQDSRVLYGGSVTSKNIAELMRYNEIDGVLVGGASLKAAEFKKIIKIAKNVSRN